MAKVVKQVVSVSQVETVRKTELAELNKVVPQVVRKAEAMQVKSASDETIAYEAVCQMRKMLKTAEQRRKVITDPLDAAKKETIKLFKDMTEPLQQAVGSLTGKIAEWRDEQERVAAEAERQRQAEIARLEAERQAALDKAEQRKTTKGKANAMAVADELDDAVTELEQVEYVPDRGAATVPKVWTYEVEDDEQVPREYCSPDRGKLRQAVRSGVRKIAGVRIFQESSVRTR